MRARLFNSFTLFTNSITTKRANIANLCFLICCSLYFDQSIQQTHHDEKNLNLGEEIAVISSAISVLGFIFINWETIKETVVNILKPQEQDKIIISNTLKNCIERGTRLAQKRGQLPNNLEIPEKFQCPISHDSFNCPILASDGHAYDFESFLKIYQRGFGSSFTREKFTASVSPMIVLQDEIEKWLDAEIELKNQIRVRIV